MEFALEGHGYSLGRALRVPGLFSERGPRDPGDGPGARVPPPELLASLHVRAPSSPRAALSLEVARSIRQVFDDLRPRLDLAITHCTFDEVAPDGAILVVGAHFPSLTADVLRDDTVAAGVILALHDAPRHGDPGGGAHLEVLHRLFRKVCENGAIVHARDEAAVAVDLRQLGADPAGRARLTAELERRIAATHDAALFTAAVGAFRAAAADTLDRRGGPHGASLRHALVHDVWQSVMARYTDEPWTRWSLANALTAEAHHAPTLTEALRLERLGGFLARSPGRPYDILPPGLLDPTLAAPVPAEDDEKVRVA
jgi:hypothetical protein